MSGSNRDPRLITICLWTFAHGAASPLIDEDYAVVAPDPDVMAMIEETTPLIFGANGRATPAHRL